MVYTFRIETYEAGRDAAERRPSARRALPTSPVELEALSTPSDDRFRLHDDQRRLPIRPHLREPSPKQSVPALEVRAFDSSLLDNQLLAKGQILQDQIAPADKQAAQYEE